MPKSSMNTLYYYCYVFTVVLFAFVGREHRIRYSSTVGPINTAQITN